MSLIESNYNIHFKYQSNNFIFNSLKCSLIKFNKQIKDADKGALNILEKNGFLVDSTFNEIEFLKYINMKSRFVSDTLTLTLFPTMACNCACSYCYEKDLELSKNIMSFEICDYILDFIEKVAKKHKNIYIIWHGGEPLLAKDVIWYISEKTLSIKRKYNVDYNAFIISNLCLLNDDIIGNFLKYKILALQATIDGLPKTHNARRTYKNGDPTFDLILKNILKLQAKNIAVDLRLNIDKLNKDEIIELIELLHSSGVHIDDNLYLGFLRGPQNKKHEYLKISEYANICTHILRYLMNKFPNNSFNRWYPKFKGKFCLADSYNSYSIDFNGDIYKCWHDVGNKNYAMSNIRGFNLPGFNQNLSYSMYSLPINEECKNCNILPLCLCNCAKYRNTSDYCLEYKYNLIDILKCFIDKNKDELLKNETFVLKHSNNIDTLFERR